MELNKILEVVSRVENSKGFRHAKDAYLLSIEELIESEEYQRVFKDDLKIDSLSEDEVSLIIQLLAK